MCSLGNATEESYLSAPLQNFTGGCQAARIQRMKKPRDGRIDGSIASISEHKRAGVAAGGTVISQAEQACRQRSYCLSILYAGGGIGVARMLSAYRDCHHAQQAAGMASRALILRGGSSASSQLARPALGGSAIAVIMAA